MDVYCSVKHVKFLLLAHMLIILRHFLGLQMNSNDQTINRAGTVHKVKQIFLSTEHYRGLRLVYMRWVNRSPLVSEIKKQNESLFVGSGCNLSFSERDGAEKVGRCCQR